MRVKGRWVEVMMRMRRGTMVMGGRGRAEEEEAGDGEME
jgi:hypothetical protein